MRVSLPYDLLLNIIGGDFDLAERDVLMDAVAVFVGFPPVPSRFRTDLVPAEREMARRRLESRGVLRDGRLVPDPKRWAREPRTVSHVDAVIAESFRAVA